MKDAKDFRLGNYINDDNGNPVRITSVSDIMVCCDNWGFEPENIKPIPLTEDILLKAGFEKEDRFWWDRCIKIRLLDNNSTIYVTGGELPLIMLNHYKYVHQLQNLYFALTGEELTINFEPVTNRNGLN